MNILLILVGSITGLSIGFLGTGAGVLMIPGMIYLGGLTFQEAVGITLLMQTLPVGALGAYQYWEKGLLRLIPSIMIGVGMLLGITLGGYLATRGVIQEMSLRKMFGVLAIITGVSMVI